MPYPLTSMHVFMSKLLVKDIAGWRVEALQPFRNSVFCIICILLGC